MKRSKIVKLIMDTYNNTDPYSEKYMHYIEAESILDVIENAGMLPPIEPGRTVHDLDLGVPEWEPEDET